MTEEDDLFGLLCGMGAFSLKYLGSGIYKPTGGVSASLLELCTASCIIKGGGEV